MSRLADRWRDELRHQLPKDQPVGFGPGIAHALRVAGIETDSDKLDKFVEAFHEVERHNAQARKRH